MAKVTKRRYFSGVKHKPKKGFLNDDKLLTIRSVNNANVTFGEYIKTKRLEKKIKFEDLRSYLGCYSATLSKYVANEIFPAPERMALLCSALEIDPVFLYALTNRIHPDMLWKLVTLIREDSNKVVQMVDYAFNSYMNDTKRCSNLDASQENSGVGSQKQ